MDGFSICVDFYCVGISTSSTCAPGFGNSDGFFLCRSFPSILVKSACLSWMKPWQPTTSLRMMKARKYVFSCIVNALRGSDEQIGEDDHSTGGGLEQVLKNILTRSFCPRQPTEFTVMIVACAPIADGLVYAVTIQQPVQSWTVLRSHDDFLAVGEALSQMLVGLPPCPGIGNVNPADLNSILKKRNELQEWLSRILMYPGARESPDITNFLTQYANTIPPQYVGVAWTQFNQITMPQNNHNVDDMDMDDMFVADDDAQGPDDAPDDDEDFIPSASVRYKPTNEAPTDEDEMDILQLAGEVEMVEDIGSLAQSLGASHLGRSLQLQAEMKHGGRHETQSRPLQGLNVGGASSHSSSSGGIGSAMAQANAQGTVGASFNQRAPQSPARLDSFKMIRVIGKGSFGKSPLLFFFLDCILSSAYPHCNRCNHRQGFSCQRIYYWRDICPKSTTQRQYH